MDVSGFPRVALAHLPTPLEELPAFRQAAAATPRLFVKRDDCTGLACGGNKSRKLEFTVADALAKNADTIITTGGLQSNHVRQTAAAAAKFGLTFQGVVCDPFTNCSYQAADSYASTGNRLLDTILGGQLHVVADDGPTTDAKVAALVEAAKVAGRTPYVIPVGASNGIGALGYVACAEELLVQFTAREIEPTHIVVATGSAGTQGGLLAGLRTLGSSIQVVGISVSEPAAAKRSKVRRILDEVAALFADHIPSIADDEIIVHDDYVGEGYGVPTAAAVDAIRLLAATEGILLDPVYTGKAMAGCLDLLRNGDLAAGRDIVFMHTGGTPALFAYGNLF